MVPMYVLLVWSYTEEPHTVSPLTCNSDPRTFQLHIAELLHDLTFRFLEL